MSQTTTADSAKSDKLDQMWEDTQSRLAQFEADKDAFEREFGFTFDHYVKYSVQQISEAQETLGEYELAQLDAERERLDRQFEADVAMEKSQSKTSGKRATRSRRMRNRI